MLSCAQIVLDTADSVRDGDVSTVIDSASLHEEGEVATLLECGRVVDNKPSDDSKTKMPQVLSETRMLLRGQ